MSYVATVARTWNENVLLSVMLELTYRCNLSCFYCYNDQQQRGPEMSDRLWHQLLEDLARMQVLHLCFSGGEPLEHPSFFELAGHARQLGFVVRLKSNGHRLDRETVRRLRDEVEPFIVDVSLHGATAGAHERQTRVAGSHERLLRQLAAARDAGLRLRLSCTLTTWNEDELEEMMVLADRLELPLAVNPVVTPGDSGDRRPLALAPSSEAVRRLSCLIEERSQAREHDGRPPGHPPRVDTCCGAGTASLTIDPFGNVLPCVQWRRPLGNLHEAAIRDIWEGSAALQEVRRINREARRRLDLLAEGAGNLQQHCPGLAELLRNDPLAIEP